MDATMQCPCPQKDGEIRHPDGDTVTLRDKLDWRSVVAIRQGMSMVGDEDPSLANALKLATYIELCLLMGITSWTLVDESWKPIVVSHAAIRERLFQADVDFESVSQAAEILYNPVVLLPLVNRASASSPPTPTPSKESADTTSAKSDSETTPPRQLKQSSTSTTRTVATETTTSSPVGGSSSSQSEASAA